MKIHLNGFSVKDLCPAFDLGTLRANAPKYTKFKLYNRGRVLSYGKRGSYLVGLLASSTDQDKDVVLSFDNQGKPHFTIHDTSDDGERQAFNFFALNVNTGMGLVSRYHGAGSVSSFGRVLRSQYVARRRKYREKYIQELHDSGDGFNESKERKKFSKGKVVIKPVFREGTFEELLKTLNVITELSYDEPNVKEPKYALVRDQLRLDRRQLKFEVSRPKKKKWINNKRDKIVEFIKEKIINRGVDVATVHGKNTAGKDMPPVTIDPEIDSFGEYKYNEVVVEDNLKVDAIASAPFVHEIVKIAHANAGIFETPIE